MEHVKTMSGLIEKCENQGGALIVPEEAYEQVSRDVRAEGYGHVHVFTMKDFINGNINNPEIYFMGLDDCLNSLRHGHVKAYYNV